MQRSLWQQLLNNPGLCRLPFKHWWTRATINTLKKALKGWGGTSLGPGWLKWRSQYWRPADLLNSSSRWSFANLKWGWCSFENRVQLWALFQGKKYAAMRSLDSGIVFSEKLWCADQNWVFVEYVGMQWATHTHMCVFTVFGADMYSVFRVFGLHNIYGRAPLIDGWPTDKTEPQEECQWLALAKTTTV